MNNIQPGFLTLAQLRELHAGSQQLTIDPSAAAGIRGSAQLVWQAAQGGAAVYGVNTGFGKLANQRIAQADLDALQLNLLRSHAVGVGASACTNWWCRGALAWRAKRK